MTEDEIKAERARIMALPRRDVARALDDFVMATARREKARLHDAEWRDYRRSNKLGDAK